MVSPDDINDYDDGITGPIWGYNWQAHFVADATAVALVLASVAAFSWLTLIGRAGF